MSICVYTCLCQCRTGPLIGTWCMRMEGKNSFFKRAAQSSNFKNVAYSVSRRHQHLLCGYLQSDNFFGHILESGPGRADTLTYAMHPIVVCFLREIKCNWHCLCTLFVLCSSSLSSLPYKPSLPLIFPSLLYTFSLCISVRMYITRLVFSLSFSFPGFLPMSPFFYSSLLTTTLPFIAKDPKVLQEEDREIFQKIMEMEREVMPTAADYVYR